MDGRYLKSEMAGEMPGMGPYSGLGLIGFDNISKKFVATWADNPLGLVPPQLQAIGFDPSDFTTGVGSYHQKFQVVRRSADALGNRVIGYLGGVDINQGRLDTWGHHGSAWIPPDRPSRQPSVRAFHDVHVRITGPAQPSEL